jgi:hypothetical protein
MNDDQTIKMAQLLCCSNCPQVKELQQTIKQQSQASPIVVRT